MPLAEHRALLDRLQASPRTGREFRDEAMRELDGLDGYDWSGVYVLEESETGPGTLVLDAYVGAPTDHGRIPVGRGVCGTAVATGEDQVVDDVRDLTNYLSCSVSTRSEIVVLIRSEGKIVGQIDIDSHQTARFGEEDAGLLRDLAALIAERW